MIFDRILIRYGDLTLKGKNQKMFVDKVVSLVKNKLKDLNVKIEKEYNRLYVLLNNENYLEVLKCLDRVSGLRSYSLVAKCQSDIESIKEKALELVQKEIPYETTFKIETKRANKKFPTTSLETTKIVASYVLSNTSNLHVDVHNPRETLNIEIREEGTYLYTGEFLGMGGFPVGSGGKGLLMMSGGIDSPVAGYLSMKQGVEIEVIHFESTPLTSIESAQKVVDLTKKLALYSPNNSIKLHMIPFMELHQQLLKNIPESYNITIMRRMMYRIASKLAASRGILVLINGESIGQVASQTLESMSVINNVTNMPVIRPLATTDKIDIMSTARKIDTYELSIKPFEDCCTVYVPKNPVIKPTLEKCIEFEKNFDYQTYVDKAVEEVRTITITHDSSLDLPLLGLEVKSVI